MIKKIFAWVALVIVFLVAYTSQARITGTQPTLADGWCVGATNAEGCFDASGNFIPTVTNNQTLGSSALRWSTIYGTNLNITALSLTNPNFAQIFVSTITPYQSASVYFSTSLIVAGNLTVPSANIANITSTGSATFSILTTATETVTGRLGVNGEDCTVSGCLFGIKDPNGETEFYVATGSRSIAGTTPGGSAYSVLNINATNLGLNLDTNGVIRTGTGGMNVPANVSASSMSLTGTGGFNHANASSFTFTGNGSMGYDQTLTTLAIGNGTNAQVIGPLGSFGTWVPTFAGFSAAPTGVTAHYIRIGRFVYAWFNATAGTSNATTFTMTLPFAAQALIPLAGTCIATNNGTTATTAGRVDTRSGSNIADFYLLLDGTGWTGSGSKNCQGYIMFETNAN